MMTLVDTEARGWSVLIWSCSESVVFPALTRWRKEKSFMGPKPGTRKERVVEFNLVVFRTFINSFKPGGMLCVPPKPAITCNQTHGQSFETSHVHCSVFENF